MIAGAEQGPDWLRTVTGKQPMHWAEVEPGFAAAATAPSQVTHDKGHGRIGQRHDTGWRAGQRRVPGEMRLRGAVRFIRTTTRVETAGRNRSEARYARSSRALTAPAAAVCTSESACTGSPASPSGTTSRVCAKAMAPDNWPPSVTRPQPRPSHKRPAIQKTPPKNRRSGYRRSPVNPRNARSAA